MEHPLFHLPRGRRARIVLTGIVVFAFLVARQIGIPTITAVDLSIGFILFFVSLYLLLKTKPIYKFLGGALLLGLVLYGLIFFLNTIGVFA